MMIEQNVFIFKISEKQAKRMKFFKRKYLEKRIENWTEWYVAFYDNNICVYFMNPDTELHSTWKHFVFIWQDAVKPFIRVRLYTDSQGKERQTVLGPSS